MPGTSADDLSETGEKQVEHESAFSRAKHGEEGLITKEEEMNCHFSSRIQTLDYRCLERICVFKQIKKIGPQERWTVLTTGIVRETQGQITCLGLMCGRQSALD